MKYNIYINFLFQPEEVKIEVPYTTPNPPANAYLFETFDDLSIFEKKWIKSKAKKDDVDENIAKYDGKFFYMYGHIFNM